MRPEWRRMSPAAYAKAVPDEDLRDELRRARFHEMNAPEISGRAATVMGVLVNELRAHTGHFGGTLQEVLGDEIHDRRRRDTGGCLTCRILELADDVLGRDGR